MRLHITPLDPDLLPIVLGPGLAKSAANTSYQSIDTFPESNYGFVDLPPQDAKKLITKMNGAILRGKKMKVEEARPKQRSSETVDDDKPSKAEKSRKKPRGERKEKEVLEGYELPADRKVKRGWTESKSEKSTSKKDNKPRDTKKAKSRAASKYTEKAELLFRTKLPPNKEDLTTVKDKKSNKRTTSDTVVHEFEKTAPQLSFLRNTTPAGSAAEYVDNVGWVDSKGDVVEEEPPHLKRKRSAKLERLMIDIPSPKKPKVASSALKEQPLTTPTSSNSSASAASDTREQVVPYDETSSSGTFSSSASATEPALGSSHGDEHGRQSLQPPPIEVVAAPETPPKVHPLEALFKKPRPPAGHDAAKPSLEIETSFSFFTQAPEEDDELPPMPNTPFTSQDMYSRGVRSAAPTPDTAHPSRFASFAGALAARTQDPSDDESLNEADGTDRRGPNVQQPEKRDESDFEKRFWAERGSNNRAWKASKRAALKEQRQKHNRLRGSRN